MMKDKLHNPTLRVIEIIETIAENQSGLSLSQISNMIHCPKSTLIPILKTLCERNYLLFSKETLLYTMGKEILFLSSMYDSTDTTLNLIQEQIKRLSTECNETCHLGILTGNEIMYLLKITTNNPIQLISSVGKRLPAYATALGKALLFDKNLKELEELFPEPFQQFTSHTLQTPLELFQNIHSNNKDKFTYENEEITKHACCIALPIRQNGKIVAALSVSFLTFTTSSEHILKIKKELLKSASIIEKIIKNKGFSY